MRRIEILEQLRGIAALAVTLYHLVSSQGLVSRGSWLNHSAEYGWLGVEVFFVISGFIIPYSLFVGGYKVRQHFGVFVFKRFRRLEPPYLASIALTLALGYATSLITGNAYQVGWTRLALHLGYLNAFTEYKWINPVYWTLGIELQFYLLAAACFPLIASTRKGLAMGAIVALLASSLFWRSPDGPEHQQMYAWVFPYGGLFALGIASFHKRCGQWGDSLYLCTALAASGVICLTMGPLHAGTGAITAVLLAYANTPRIRVLSWLGAISYSLYLVHFPIGSKVASLGARIADTDYERLAFVAFGLCLSLVTAHLMYRFVEQPSLRWSKQLTYSQPSSQVDAAPCANVAVS